MSETPRELAQKIMKECWEPDFEIFRIDDCTKIIEADRAATFAAALRLAADSVNKTRRIQGMRQTQWEDVIPILQVCAEAILALREQSQKPERA